VEQRVGEGGYRVTATDAFNEITDEFDEPYFAGQGPTGPEETNLPVALDGRGYILDLVSQQFTRRSVQLINTQQQDASQDGALLEPEVWRRIIDSWHFGDGQTRYDRPASVPFRFNASEHINVWDQWGISLLPKTIRILDLTEGTVPDQHPIVMVVFDQTQTFVAMGTGVWWWTDLSGNPATPPAPTHVTAPEQIYSACSDGKNVYTLGAGGIVRKWTSATTSTVFATVSPFTVPGLIRYVKNFLVVATGNHLYDVTTGVPLTIFIHPLVDYRWVDGCDGLACAYFLGGIGDRWSVSSVSIGTDGVTLGPPVHAAPIPDGEVGLALGSYLGYVVVGLNTGWRFGVPQGDNSLTFGRLVKTDTPVRCFEGQDSFVWFGADAPAVSGLTLFSAPALAGLGRADLSTFIAPMTPAAAADLTTDTDTGIVRNVATLATSSQPLGRRIFTVDGAGVFLEHEHLCPEGTLDQGLLTFNTSDLKQGLYAQAYCEPLTGEIEVFASWDGGTEQSIGLARQANVTTLGNLRANTEFTSLQLHYTLRRNPLIFTDGPRLTRVEFRAVQVPGRSSQWNLPLIVHTTINDDSVTENRDVMGDYDALVELVETRRTFIYREGIRQYSVYATGFVWLPHHLTDDGRTYEGTFLLTIRESR
jgi:hypothetical protein